MATPQNEHISKAYFTKVNIDDDSNTDVEKCVS